MAPRLPPDAPDAAGCCGLQALSDQRTLAARVDGKAKLFVDHGELSPIVEAFGPQHRGMAEVVEAQAEVSTRLADQYTEPEMRVGLTRAILQAVPVVPDRVAPLALPVREPRGSQGALGPVLAVSGRGEPQPGRVRFAGEGIGPCCPISASARQGVSPMSMGQRTAWNGASLRVVLEAECGRAPLSAWLSRAEPDLISPAIEGLRLVRARSSETGPARGLRLESERWGRGGRRRRWGGAERSPVASDR